MVEVKHFSRVVGEGRVSRVDGVLTDLAAPHVVDGQRLAEFDVVVRSEIESGVRHQIWARATGPW